MNAQHIRVKPDPLFGRITVLGLTTGAIYGAMVGGSIGLWGLVVGLLRGYGGSLDLTGLVPLTVVPGVIGGLAGLIFGVAAGLLLELLADLCPYHRASNAFRWLSTALVGAVLLGGLALLPLHDMAGVMIFKIGPAVFAAGAVWLKLPAIVRGRPRRAGSVSRYTSFPNMDERQKRTDELGGETLPRVKPH